MNAMLHLLLLAQFLRPNAAVCLRDNMDKERVPQEQNGHIRNLQEVFEYAVERGRLDPHVAQGHTFDNGNLVLPVYQSLGPSQVGKYPVCVRVCMPVFSYSLSSC